MKGGRQCEESGVGRPYRGVATGTGEMCRDRCVARQVVPTFRHDNSVVGGWRPPLMMNMTQVNRMEHKQTHSHMHVHRQSHTHTPPPPPKKKKKKTRNQEVQGTTGKPAGGEEGRGTGGRAHTKKNKTK